MLIQNIVNSLLLASPNFLTVSLDASTHYFVNSVKSESGQYSIHRKKKGGSDMADPISVPRPLAEALCNPFKRPMGHDLSSINWREISYITVLVFRRGLRRPVILLQGQKK